MSFFPAQDPSPGEAPACDALEQIIVPRTSDLGGFSVRRALPSARRRMVGPFVFLDHMGPAEFRAGSGLDVRPHPHIGLATVTYLFAGEIEIFGDRFAEGRLLVFRPGDRITVTALAPARLAVLGGAMMDGPRHIWWNFVSSRRERIEQAKADWKAGRFDAVPGEREFIPPPET